MHQAKPKGVSKPPKTGIALADVKSGRGGKKSGCSGRITLEWWKHYLDSCASYHTFFVKEFLKSIEEGGGTMTGNCNAGTTRITKKGSYGDLQVWLNKQGVANLISIPCSKQMGTLYTLTQTGSGQ